MALVRELRLIVKAVDQATATLKDVKGAVGDLGGEALAASKDIKPVGTALAAIGVAGAALMTTAGLTAARVEVLGTVLYTVGDNAGYAKDELDLFEAGLTAQGITIGGARSALARMMQAELDLTGAIDLATVAQDAAVIANKDSTETYGDLITVIATGRTTMAKSMGLTVDFNQAYKDLADQLGITEGDLTESQRVQARFNAVLEAGETITGAYDAAMGDVGKKLTSMPRLLEDAAGALGQAYLPAMEAVVDISSDFLEWFIDLDTETQAAVANFLAIGTAIAVPTGAIILALPQILAIGTALGTVGIIAGNVGAAFSLFAGGASMAGVASLGMAGIVGGAVLPLTLFAAAMLAVIKVAQAWPEELKRSQDAIFELGEASIWFDGVGADLEITVGDADEATRDWTEATDDLRRGMELMTGGLGDAEEAVADYDLELDLLKSAIAGPVKEANEDYIEQVKDIRQAIFDETENLQDLRLEHGLYDDAVLESIDKIDDLEEEILELAGVHEDAINRILLGMIEAQLELDGWTAAEHQFYLDSARELGLVDEGYYTLGSNVVGYFDDIREKGTDPHIADLIALRDQVSDTTSQASLDYTAYQETIREESRVILELGLNPVNAALGEVPLYIREAKEAAEGSGESIATGLHPGTLEAQILAGALLSIPANISSTISVHTTYTETGTPPTGPWTPGQPVPPTPPAPPTPPPGPGPEEYQLGTPYVPRTGYAYLHEGEAVLTREENRGGRQAGGTVTQITNYFGRDSVRSDEDMRYIMDAQQQLLELQGLRARIA